MTYAARIARAHERIRNKFGAVSDTAKLYLWHNGVAVRCYESTGGVQRKLMAALVVKEDAITVIATKADFATVPETGQDVKFGTVLATAKTYRMMVADTKEIRPFYEIDLVDPNKSTTAL
jgi:glutamate 5-kinase